jgi:hypothetical protein
MKAQYRWEGKVMRLEPITFRTSAESRNCCIGLMSVNLRSSKYQDTMPLQSKAYRVNGKIVEE